MHCNFLEVQLDMGKIEAKAEDSRVEEEDGSVYVASMAMMGKEKNDCEVDIPEGKVRSLSSQVLGLHSSLPFQQEECVRQEDTIDWLAEERDKMEGCRVLVAKKIEQLEQECKGRCCWTSRTVRARTRRKSWSSRWPEARRNFRRARR